MHLDPLHLLELVFDCYSTIKWKECDDDL
jgi:hypothetical protein